MNLEILIQNRYFSTHQLGAPVKAATCEQSSAIKWPVAIGNPGFHARKEHPAHSGDNAHG